MYHNYIFDLYGTLVDIHTNESNSYLWDKTAQIYSALGAEYTKTELKREYKKLCNSLQEKLKEDYGEIELKEAFYQLFAQKGVNPSEELVLYVAQTFRVLSRKYVSVYPEIIDLLESLKKSGKKIYLLSNAQAVFTIPELKQTKIYDYFDGIVISSEVGICKPNSDFMQHLLSKYKLNISESIMIGNDKNCDIAIANAFNMDSLYIHSNISPNNEETIKATYEILDGQFSRIKQLLL